HLHPRRPDPLPHSRAPAGRPQPRAVDPRRRHLAHRVPPSLRDLDHAPRPATGGEAMIPLREQELLKLRFARELQTRVRVDFFGEKPLPVVVPGRVDNSAASEDTRKLLQELAALNLRISLTPHDIDADAETASAMGVSMAPAIVLRGPAN